MGIYNSNFDFNKYRAFYAVAECKSFSKATELLHVSQPSISRSVKDLEQELDTKLFIRENKTVKLTENGEKLLGYVQKAFNNIIMAERALTENKEDLTGEVRIGIYSHLSLFMLPELIKEFTKIHPKVSFDIYSSSTNESTNKLKNRELDFVILQYPIFTIENEYTEDIICELENCFFSGRKYYDLYTKQQNEIVEYPLILPTRGYEDINKLEKLFKKRNMVLKTNLRVYAIETTKKLVYKDLGIGWGLKKSVEEELNNKTLYEIPISFMNPTTKFSIAYDEMFLDRTALEFLKFAKKYFNLVFNK